MTKWNPVVSLSRMTDNQMLIQKNEWWRLTPKWMLDGEFIFIGHKTAQRDLYGDAQREEYFVMWFPLNVLENEWLQLKNPRAPIKKTIKLNELDFVTRRKLFESIENGSKSE